MADRKKSVCMLVTSELDRDPRVQKEAWSASRAGWDVTVVCRTYEGPQMPYRVVTLGIGRRKMRAMKYAERLWTNVALSRAAIETRASVIHANDLDTLPAAFVASRITGAGLVYDAHELWSAMGRSDTGEAGRKVAIEVERLLSRRADAVTTVSPALAQRMADTLSIRTPTVVMNTPRYVPIEDIPPGEWLRQFEGKRVVLHQGRYVHGRGLPEALLAAKYLPDDVVIAFRGYGPIEPELRELVAREKIEHKAVFLPPVPMNDLVRSAVGADLGLVLYAPTSENNWFTAPNKLFEYIMAGVPSVGSNMPFVEKVLRGNNVGDVFRAADPQDLARVIMELLSDPERLATMRKNCREQANAYSWETEAKKLLAEYERIVARA